MLIPVITLFLPQELLKNKRIDMGQLHKTMMPLVHNENRLRAKEGRVIAMMAQADRIFKNAVAKIFNVVKYQVVRTVIIQTTMNMCTRRC